MAGFGIVLLSYVFTQLWYVISGGFTQAYGCEHNQKILGENSPIGSVSL